MHLPQNGDYIDIHVHGGKPTEGIFLLESLMAHEKKNPEDLPGVAYTFGIHPWFLNENNFVQQLNNVIENVANPGIIAIGEAGFDKLRGPLPDLQLRVFEKQIALSEDMKKPVVIHCVRAWEELLAVRKKLKPTMPWLVHGFRGNEKLADQLLSKGMFLSIWYDFVLRPESAGLLRALPKNRFFLETDGADVSIKTIYCKVANDLDIAVELLKSTMGNNFKEFFNIGSPLTTY
jgi:TatD DNase family protein